MWAPPLWMFLTPSLKCKILNQDLEDLEYEKIYNGTVEEKVKIARKFITNFKILEQEND